MTGHALIGRWNSHKARILAWAVAGHVLHQDDWYHAGADGAGPIKALRSRVSELEADGYGFHHTRRPDGTTEYALAHVPAESPPPPRALDVGDVDREDLGEQLLLELPAPRPGFWDVAA